MQKKLKQNETKTYNCFNKSLNHNKYATNNKTFATNKTKDFFKFPVVNIIRVDDTQNKTKKTPGGNQKKLSIVPFGKNEGVLKEGGME